MNENGKKCRYWFTPCRLLLNASLFKVIVWINLAKNSKAHWTISRNQFKQQTHQMMFNNIIFRANIYLASINTLLIRIYWAVMILHDLFFFSLLLCTTESVDSLFQLPNSNRVQKTFELAYARTHSMVFEHTKTHIQVLALFPKSFSCWFYLVVVDHLHCFCQL